jgi:hypothetical protein
VSDANGTQREWRKSTYCSASSTCVEVAALPEGGAAIRDGKDPQGAELRFDAAEWAAFVAAVKAGEFDPSPAERR